MKLTQKVGSIFILGLILLFGSSGEVFAGELGITPTPVPPNTPVPTAVPATPIPTNTPAPAPTSAPQTGGNSGSAPAATAVPTVAPPKVSPKIPPLGEKGNGITTTLAVVFGLLAFAVIGLMFALRTVAKAIFQAND